MWRTDFANITRMPLLGQVKLDHQLNSVPATKKLIVELNEFLGDPDGGSAPLGATAAGNVG